MPKRPKPVTNFSWRISRIRSTPAVDVGTVEAPDADAAIKVAIEKFGITDPWKQSRLVAQRIAPASR